MFDLLHLNRHAAPLRSLGEHLHVAAVAVEVEQIGKKMRLTRYKDLYDLKNKLLRYGLSLGYDYETVLEAVGEAVKNTDTPCDDFF